MSKNPVSKVKKYDNIVEKLTANQHIWQAIGAMQNAVNDITNLLNSLREPATEKKKRGTTPKSEKGKSSENIKEDRRNSLNKKSVLLAGSIVLYAADTADSGIDKKELALAEKIGAKNDKQALLTAQMLIDTAKKNQSKLEYYGVSQDDLTALENAVQNFKEVAGRKKKSEQSEDDKPKGRTNFTKILKDIDDILEEKVDRLLLRFEDSHTDFYKSYERARRSMNQKVAVVKKDGETETPDKRKAGRPRKATEATE